MKILDFFYSYLKHSRKKIKEKKKICSYIKLSWKFNEDFHLLQEIWTKSFYDWGFILYYIMISPFTRKSYS